MDVTELISEVSHRLTIYGCSRHGNPEDPVDDLVYIILSSQTEEYSYREAFNRLKQYFGDWSRLLEAPVEMVISLISVGGIQNKKAVWIQSSLRKIKQDFGQISLASLTGATDEEVIQYLTSLPGVSAKSARCIMMYTMGRSVLPVDTHVWRICRRLGIVPAVAKPTPKQQIELESVVAKNIRPALHMNMLSHGRQTCTVHRPRCADCPLSDICPSRFSADEIWLNERKSRRARQQETNVIDNEGE